VQTERQAYLLSAAIRNDKNVPKKTFLAELFKIAGQLYSSGISRIGDNRSNFKRSFIKNTLGGRESGAGAANNSRRGEAVINKL
jgi:hypothetical protein